MSFSLFQETVREGLVDVLTRLHPILWDSLENDGNELLPIDGYFPINGLALEILPWQGYAAIALRTPSDSKGIAPLLRGDWQLYDKFLDVAESAPKLLTASEHARKYWENPPSGITQASMAHLQLLAAANAIFDQTVQDLFYRTLGIADRSDDFHEWFDYLVVDPDQRVKLNYCDLIHANRITEQNILQWI